MIDEEQHEIRDLAAEYKLKARASCAGGFAYVRPDKSGQAANRRRQGSWADGIGWATPSTTSSGPTGSGERRWDTPIARRRSRGDRSRRGSTRRNADAELRADRASGCAGFLLTPIRRISRSSRWSISSAARRPGCRIGLVSPRGRQRSPGDGDRGAPRRSAQTSTPRSIAVSQRGPSVRVTLKDGRMARSHRSLRLPGPGTAGRRRSAAIPDHAVAAGASARRALRRSSYGRATKTLAAVRASRSGVQPGRPRARSDRRSPSARCGTGARSKRGQSRHPVAAGRRRRQRRNAGADGEQTAPPAWCARSSGWARRTSPSSLRQIVWEDESVCARRLRLLRSGVRSRSARLARASGRPSRSSPASTPASLAGLHERRRRERPAGRSRDCREPSAPTPPAAARTNTRERCPPRQQARGAATSELVRAIGAPTLTASIVNMTIGAGIFVLPALVARPSGTGRTDRLTSSALR